jgi:hypothetical protein
MPHDELVPVAGDQAQGLTHGDAAFTNTSGPSPIVW